MFRKLVVAVVMSLLFAVAAGPSEAAFGRTKPVHNVSEASVGSGSGNAPTLMQVEEAILKAAKRRQWLTRKIDDGHIEAWIVVRERHKAVVDITFTAEFYNITYKDSEALLYNGKKIHRNYNKWVKNLEGEINESLLGY